MQGQTSRQVGRPVVATVDLVAQARIVVAGDEIGGNAMDDRIRAFWAFCQGLPRNDGLPRRDAAGPLELKPWLGYVMVLDVLEGGRDFRYRLYGSAISSASGFDMTGRNVSEFASETGRFFLECYRRCVAEGVPLLTRNAAEHAHAMVLWERMIVPFRTANGTVQIVVVNVPLPASAVPGVIARVLDAKVDAV